MTNERAREIYSEVCQVLYDLVKTSVDVDGTADQALTIRQALSLWEIENEFLTNDDREAVLQAGPLDPNPEVDALPSYAELFAKADALVS